MSDDDLSDPALTGEILPAQEDEAARTLAIQPTTLGKAALETARLLAKEANAPATLRAYKADWTHYAAWCVSTSFGNCNASLGKSIS